MLRSLVETALRYRILVLAIAAALMIFGAQRLARAPIDVFPEFAPPTVEVQTEAAGLSAEEVESLITLNLEELLSGVPWLQSIRSQSVTGLSSIVLTFRPGTDVMRARQMMQERLTLAYTLPNVAQPPVILQPLSATARFMMIGLSSDRIDPTELSLVARWTVKPRLAGVPGVANVAIWGQRLRQMHVHIDPERLKSARVTQEDIITAAGDALWVSPLSFLKGSAPGTGGWIDNRNQRITLQHSMPIETPEDMAKIPVTPLHLTMTGKTMTLGDVAEVTFAHPPLIGDAVVKDGTGLMLVLEKLPGTNTLEVTRGVEQAIAELARGMPGVKIDATVFRLAGYVEDAIANIVRAILVGIALVLAVLAIGLRDWRALLACAIAIPLALVAALLVLHWQGATINTMVLAGLLIAVAIVIDDVVADTQAARAGDRTAQTARARRPALYAGVIIVLTALPILAMGGVAGAFFVPLARAYVLAVVASMLVALFVTPALTSLLGTARPAAALRSDAAVPRGILAGLALLVVAGVAAWPLLGQSLLPPLKERDLVVNLSTVPGTSHEETHRITTRVAAELRSIPGVRYVGGHVGRAVTGDQVVGINSSQLWVSIDRAADYATTVAAIRETTDGYPGVERNVQTYLRDKVGEALTGEGNAIVVRLYGPRREVLAEKAEEVRSALADVPGIIDLRAGGQTVEPQVRIQVDLDSAGKASVKPGDVRRASSTVFSGLVVGYLFKDQKIYEVVVWSAPEARRSLSDLANLWVEKGDRTHARLGDVASVSVAAAPTIIRHERIAPYVDVAANVAGGDAGRIVDTIEDRLEGIRFPLEYRAEILGEYTERQAAERRMAGIAIAALIGIFLVMQACFQSWWLAAIGFAALPAAVAGGALGVLAGGGVVSLGSIVGVVAGVGIAARQAIYLIDDFRALGAAGLAHRARPMLASAAAIVAMLAPIVVLGREPGLEILHSTALVLIGAVFASTLAALVLIPALYLTLGARANYDADLGLESRAA